MTLGGLALGIGDGSFWVIIGCSALIYVTIHLGALKIGGKRYANVELSYRGKLKRVTALLDTGNLLKDPVTGCPVLIVGADAAMELLDIQKEALNDPIGFLSAAEQPGFRLLPFRGVGQPHGMLLAARIDRVLINGKASGTLVAFAPDKIGGRDFQALAGGTI